MQTRIDDEKVATLYNELRDSIRSKNQDQASRVRRELVRAGRPLSEILGQATNILATLEKPKPLDEPSQQGILQQPIQNTLDLTSHSLDRLAGSIYLGEDPLSQLAAEPAAKAAKNAYLAGAVRQDRRSVLRMGLKSPIVWLCLVSAVIAASASVVDVLPLRSTAEKLAAANPFPNSARPRPARPSVSIPDSATATGATATVATAIDQNHALESPGEPRSPERSSDPERTKHLISSTILAANPPDSTAATLTATERSPEIAAATPTPVPAAPPPAAASGVPDDLSAPKPEATPAVAWLEMPKDASPNVSASPNGRIDSPTAVIPPSEPHTSTVETALLLSKGDALFGMGDVASARLFYERAADVGNGEAALRLGETYDPYFLERAHRRGVHGDLAVATRWYRRARDLRATEAEILLKRAENR